jgi:TRAP-type C4-dicarboxylate transport system substrate-binding protein
LSGKRAPQDRDVVREAGLPTCEAQKEVVLVAAKEALRYLTEHEIQTIAVENRGGFRDKVSGVYKDGGDRIGTELVAEARRLAGT